MYSSSIEHENPYTNITDKRMHKFSDQLWTFRFLALQIFEFF